MTVHLDIQGIAKSFRGTQVLSALDLAIDQGEFVSLLGPSGCGKTTMLRLVAGLLSADQGRITLGGQNLTRLPPHKRNVGVVFQNYALFPHLSVADNVAFGLKARGIEVGDTVERFLGLVHMQEFAERAPAALSGGQQQRVAVARALAVKPDILLLDEPFSALDRKLRERMQFELKQLLRELAITAVFVTHDQDEALIMSDRIAVMNAGRIEQLGTPIEIYQHPKTPFVLDFIGTSSRIEGKVSAHEGGHSRISTSLGDIVSPSLTNGPVTVAIRPEHLHLGADENTIEATLVDRVYIGARSVLHWRGAGGAELMAEMNPAEASGLEPGQSYKLGWPIAQTHVFASGDAP